MEIGDKKAWLYNEIHNADKVLLIFSKGTLCKMLAAMAQKPVDCSGGGVLGELGDMFWPGYKFATDEFEKVPNLLISKYVVAYFEYSQKEDILPEVSNVALKFQIPGNLEGLFFRLHDIPPCTPRSQRRARDLLPNSYASTSSEGHALFVAIEKMKSMIIDYSDWYENPSHCKDLYQIVSDLNPLDLYDIDPNWPAEEQGITSFIQGNQEDNVSGSIAFTDYYLSLQSERDTYQGDTGYQSREEYRGSDDLSNVSHRNMGQFAFSSNQPTFPDDDLQDFDVALKACNDRGESGNSDKDSVLSYRDIRNNEAEHLLKTLDPQDVVIHSNPPTLDRMDSGIGYMSDIHINSIPCNENTRSTPV